MFAVSWKSASTELTTGGGSKHLASLLGDDEVRLLHYDSERADLLGSFMRNVASDLDGAFIPAAATRRRTGRARPRTELALMTFANTLVHDKMSARKDQ